MKKLKLDWDALVVDSFETAAPETQRGTVRANATEVLVCTSEDYASCGGTCEPYTCLYDCGGTGGTGGGGGSNFSCRVTAPAGDTCCLRNC